MYLVCTRICKAEMSGSERIFILNRFCDLMWNAEWIFLLVRAGERVVHHMNESAHVGPLTPCKMREEKLNKEHGTWDYKQ